MAFEISKTIQSIENKEKTQITEIRLECIRHGIKEKYPNGFSDSKIRLSQEGKINTIKKGKELDFDPNKTFVWASPKDRTQETGNYILYQDERGFNKLKSGRIKKIRIGHNLDYCFGKVRGKRNKRSFEKGQYLNHIADESDRLAIEDGNLKSSTLSRSAGYIAEIFSRYLKIGENFNKIAETKDYKRINRILVSHQGEFESFLLKIIKMKEGEEEQKRIADVLGNGFKELEGFSIKILNKGKSQRINLACKIDRDNEKIDKNIYISKEDIDEILEDWRKFEKKVRSDN